MLMQSATHLGLCPPGVGILYQHISAPLSLSTLLNDCPLYRSPICYAKKFLFLLSVVVFQLVPYLFFTKVSEELLSIVCKHLVLLVVFTSFYISPDSFIWAFSFNFPFEGFSYCLQILVCCHFVFLLNSLLFLGDLSVPCLLVSTDQF